MLALRVLVIVVCAAFFAGEARADANTETDARAPPSALWEAAVRTAVHNDASLQAMAPRDISTYCPAFASLDAMGREAFWSALLIDVARTESGGDATRTRWLFFDGAIHRPGFRRGLFQISVEAAQSRRYHCAIASAAELTGVDVNTACALRILENAIATRDEISSAGRYWPTIANERERARLARNVAASSPCGGGSK